MEAFKEKLLFEMEEISAAWRDTAQGSLRALAEPREHAPIWHLTHINTCTTSVYINYKY